MLVHKLTTRYAIGPWETVPQFFDIWIRSAPEQESPGFAVPESRSEICNFCK